MNTSAKLSRYISKKTLNKDPIPKITEIAEVTGVSPASITRYVRANGYSNYGQFRATLNLEFSQNEYDFNNAAKVLNTFRDEKVYVMSSKSTEICAIYAKERLMEIGFYIKHIKNVEEITDKKAHIVFFTITKESYRLDKLIKHVGRERINLITTAAQTKKDKYLTYVKPFNKYMVITNLVQKNNAVVELISWENQLLNHLISII